jgi:hypothetical protein
LKLLFLFILSLCFQSQGGDQVYCEFDWVLKCYHKDWKPVNVSPTNSPLLLGIQALNPSSTLLASLTGLSSSSSSSSSRPPIYNGLSICETTLEDLLDDINELLKGDFKDKRAFNLIKKCIKLERGLMFFSQKYKTNMSDINDNPIKLIVIDNKSFSTVFDVKESPFSQFFGKFFSLKVPTQSFTYAEALPLLSALFNKKCFGSLPRKRIAQSEYEKQKQLDEENKKKRKAKFEKEQEQILQQQTLQESTDKLSSQPDIKKQKI